VLAPPSPLRPLSPARWSEADLLALPEDGWRYELLDGALLVSPPPSFDHQEAELELAVQLRRQAPPHLRVVTTPYIRMGASVRVPDVVVVARDLVPPGTVVADAAAVRLAVEVVSPGHAEEDRVTKPILYARAGIPVFWRLEPGPLLQVHVLHGDAYERTGEHHSGQVRLDLPFTLVLDLDLLPRRG